MEPQQFIQNLGSELGLSDLKFSDELTCRLIVGDQAVIDLEWVEAEGVLQMYSAIGPEPQDESELLREMLVANLFGAGTGKAVLAIDESAREVLLCREFAIASFDTKQFAEQLNAFIERTAYWTERLAKIEPGDSSEGDSEAFTPPAGADILRP
ncbi:hypothetical protein GC197_09055 [bacterium]|nr:hypothetical protein [bacterium]